MRKIIAASVAGVVLAFVFYGGGYAIGTANADARAAQLAAERGARYAAELADGYRARAELVRALGAAQERADRIGRGLAEGIELAGRATDRGRRIAILVDAIDRAIGAIGGGAGSGATGGP
jgi:hypothetical protein